LFQKSKESLGQSFVAPLSHSHTAQTSPVLLHCTLSIIHQDVNARMPMSRFWIALLFLVWQMTNVVNGAMKDLKISELMIALTSATDTTTRWMELYNPASVSVSLNSIGLFVASAVKSNTFYARPNTNYTIAAFGYAIIGNNANRTTNGNINVNVVETSALEYFTADGSGTNEVYIYDKIEGAYGDNLRWSTPYTANYVNLSIAPGVSLMRTNQWNGATQSADWQSSTVFIHFGSSMGDQGSPGRNNTLSAPTRSPTRPPTRAPTRSPTKSPTRSPTKSPTRSPTKSPTCSPTKSPTRSPTKSPTRSPTRSPTKSPTRSPTTSLATNAPATHAPVSAPHAAPVASPLAVPISTPVYPSLTAPMTAPVSAPVAVPVSAPPLVSAATTNAPATNAPVNALRQTSTPTTTRAPLSLIAAPVAAPPVTVPPVGKT
jgi:hypothetical protein